MQPANGESVEPSRKWDDDGTSGDKLVFQRVSNPQLCPNRPPISAGMDSNYNRIAGLAMHPVEQRDGVDDRKGGGTTVAAATPLILLPLILLLFLPLALLILH